MTSIVVDRATSITVTIPMHTTISPYNVNTRYSSQILGCHLFRAEIRFYIMSPSYSVSKIISHLPAQSHCERTARHYSLCLHTASLLSTITPSHSHHDDSGPDSNTHRAVQKDRPPLSPRKHTTLLSPLQTRQIRRCKTSTIPSWCCVSTKLPPPSLCRHHST
jgi:hypothetical protein